MSEGIRIEVPEPGAAAVWGPEFDLPSGKKARVRPVTGRLLINAQRLVGRDASPLESHCATIAVASQVDGRQPRYDEAQDLIAGDISALIDRINTASFLASPSSSAQASSQPSSNSASM